MPDHNTEREDLIALLESPGWQRFRAFAQQEWGAEAYRIKVRQILSGLSTNNTGDAAGHVLQLESAARAIEQLFAWVIDRVKKLQAQEAGAVR